MSHIVNMTKIDGGLQLHHEAEDDSQETGVYSDYSIRKMNEYNLAVDPVYLYLLWWIFLLQAYVESLFKEFGESQQLSYIELNLETWRQLWRVLEMSDIVLLIADIRYTVSF